MKTICNDNMPMPRSNSPFTWEDYYKIKENSEKVEKEYLEQKTKEFLEKYGRNPEEDEIPHLIVNYS